MPTYPMPKCLTCKNFIGDPVKPGAKARCVKKIKGVPNTIYWKGAGCASYVPKAVNVRKK